MKFLFPTLGALAIASVSASPAKRADSKSFGGTNLYYLQGLSDDAQDQYISDLSDYGVKVVRLWVNQQSSGSCVKGSKLEVGVPALETTLGQYNDQTLDAVDKVIQKLSDKGIKSLISPHDANSLLGDYRADVYGKKWNKKSFYTDSAALEAYNKRIDHIFNYKGKTSNKVWKEWSDAIFAFDIQNEPMSPDTSVCKSDGDSKGWLCNVAKHMRETLGADNPIRIATGGIGGDDSHGCSMIKAATGCDQIDLIAIHRYTGPQSSNPTQWSGSTKKWVDQSNSKLVFVEEWGVDTSKNSPKTELAAQAADLNKASVPNLYWQYLPKKTCDYNPAKDSGDKFGIFVESDTNIKSVVQQSNNADALQDWSQYIK
ncbi:glycoside hydrolase family 5 protein [Xylariomycetidae sp. FL2044]|nr:glycoside hydrolase family 5 protein [Xylariomycetidae sp. FL2044]